MQKYRDISSEFKKNIDDSADQPIVRKSQTPMVKPKIEAIITPVTATKRVFNKPTTAALKWVSVGEKDMKGWKVIS
jgi:hypothetical protein